jgi:hypothetical protein
MSRLEGMEVIAKWIRQHSVVEVLVVLVEYRLEW